MVSFTHKTEAAGQQTKMALWRADYMAEEGATLLIPGRSHEFSYRLRSCGVERVIMQVLPCPSTLSVRTDR